MEWINVAVGALLLLFGRRLFWLFVAGVGFVVGITWAKQWLGGGSDLVAFIVAIGVGLIGAILSVFLQRLVVAIAGFLAGGYLLGQLAFALNYNAYAWIAFLVGGIIGAILVAGLFDWALIVLSALTGATAIVQSFTFAPSASILIFVVLALLGIIVQARQLAPSEAPPRPREV